jgi:hypothetical protein
MVLVNLIKITFFCS